MLARARRLAEWERIIARNQWFQRKVVGALNSQLSTLSSQPILLSYSYAALEPFRFAKLHGWKTLLLQIDPGPEEERIVAEEVARVPGAGRRVAGCAVGLLGFLASRMRPRRPHHR